MAVTFNNTGTISVKTGGAPLSTSFSVTAGGVNTVAFCPVWIDELTNTGSPTFTTTVTYGGNSMTSCGAAVYNYGFDTISCQVFYLINPPTGSNTLVVTSTPSANTIDQIVANLVSFNGVHQVTPVRAGTYQTLSALYPGGDSFSATLTSDPSDLTFGALEQGSSFGTPATNQTSDGTTNFSFVMGSDHATTAAATITDTWKTTTSGSPYAYVGFSIQSAAVTGWPIPTAGPSYAI